MAWIRTQSIEVLAKVLKNASVPQTLQTNSPWHTEQTRLHFQRHPVGGSKEVS